MKNTVKNDVALAILRVVPSLMLLTHGIPKLQKILGGNLEFADPIGIGAAPSLFLAVIGEVICPVLVILGIRTRWATIPTIIMMAVISFVHHANDTFKSKELALLFLTFFVLIYLLGPGKYSFDKK
ncbi:DoxX family protein [Flavobacteriaceae bacterium F89]|uniref:DoxX family protein n=1 Tax=Cerina litoralis TaxID=2874477 RepID=A0AAE3ETB5_9FLAO|nr:DoxX family protein [Cerina litoralis]MCG2460782.1 DoxX family protein [Cerina litoralis]